MLVRHAMTVGAETITPHESLREAARRMRSADIGALVVREEEDGDRLHGVLTDRDIVTRAVAAGLDPGLTPVSFAMSPVLIACRDEDPVEEAARLMVEHSVRRLAVLGADGRLVGVLSVDDLALVDRPLAAAVVEHARDPERPPVGLGPPAS
jgi:CBS domain-containing protein